MNTQGSNTLKGVYLLDKIRKIGDQAFYKQTGMTDVALNIEDLNATSILPKSIKEIGANAYAGDVVVACQFTISALPAELTTLGDKAFYRGGSNITFRNLPATLTSIPEYAFAYCPNITIDRFDSIGNTPFTIGKGAFYQVSRIGPHSTVLGIYLGNNVSRIGENAFTNYGATDNLPAYTTKEFNDIFVGVNSGISLTKWTGASA